MASEPPTPGIACAENIALLYLLHRVPNLPLSNPIEDSTIREDGYILPFEKERSLVSTLAFLCNVEEDVDHIPAVCVQQNVNKTGLKVLLAMNRKGPDEGGKLSKDLAQRLGKMFAILARLSNGKTPQTISCNINNIENNKIDIEEAIFDAIVSMCSDRILLRMRFISGRRKKSKQPMKALIEEVISAVEKTKNERTSQLGPAIELFLIRCKMVIKLVALWADHQTPTRLKDLIEGVYHLWQIKELTAVVMPVSAKILDPSQRNNFLNMVIKIARYREAARFLYRTAKKFAILRNMRTEIVKLSQNAFTKDSLAKYTPSLSSTFLRIRKRNTDWDVEYIVGLLGTTVIKAENSFVDQMKLTVQKSKIHAEIQLLFYIEQYATKFPPRAICSSKDACFLCNATIITNGKIHMPRSHGKLYPSWRLPVLPQSRSVTQRLNEVLENRIRDTIETMLRRRQKTFYPDPPNESTLLTLPNSVSTLHSFVEQNVAIGNSKELQSQRAIPPRVEDKESRLANSEASSLSTKGISNTDNIQQSAPTTVTESEPEQVPLLTSSILSTSREPSSVSTVNSVKELMQGQMLSKRIRANGKVHQHRVEGLELFVEYTVERSQVKHEPKPKKLRYKIKWLAEEEAKSLSESNVDSIIDVESLNMGATQEIDSINNLYFSGEGSVLEFVLVP
jgi:hypothetical protein